MTESVAISAGIVQSVVTLIFWGVVFTAAAVVAARRLRGRLVWCGWLALVAILTFVATRAFHSAFPTSGASVVGTVYMASMFVGIPTAAVALVATRMQRRIPRRSWIAQFAAALLAFFGSLPLALIVGAIPDFARLW